MRQKKFQRLNFYNDCTTLSPKVYFRIIFSIKKIIVGTLEFSSKVTATIYSGNNPGIYSKPKH